MDRSWILLRDRTSPEYIAGVDTFIDFAFKNKDRETSRIKCPCPKCVNRFFHYLDSVKGHIEMYGFEKSYQNWIYHGERFIPSSSSDIVVENEPIEANSAADMMLMVQEGMCIPHIDDNARNDATRNDYEPDGSIPEYFKLLKEAESELYENCPEGITELSFIVELLNLKQLSGWTNRSFTLLLELLRKHWPNAKIPKSWYRANKLTTDLGFTFETWDACPNSCMIFKDQFQNLENCEICDAPRYKKDVAEVGDHGESKHVIRVAEKKMRYFPLKPRLQRLFWSSHTAPLMRWHAEERINDDVMRHPADSRAWKSLDENNPNFAREIRNVRLGLATDGFNPFGNMSNAHSTWPVVLVPYNLPPWLCTKQSHLILSILIDGPKSPGDKIDVFLQPLIDELKELWNEGVSTFDSSKKEFFQLHAALLWTVSDFPAYAMLSGWSTKGEFACPYCNNDHQALWLDNGRKYCYWGHRRFLPPRHKCRKEKETFNGKVDLKPPPLKLTSSQVLNQLNELDIETEYRKEDVFKRRARKEHEKELAKATKGELSKTRLNWKKKSIFFELPYWEHNVVRHNLDVMHIEKNFCDNVLFTLLGTKFKTKDNLNARKDLKAMKIRTELHPKPRGANLEYLAPAEFTMSSKEKDIFLRVLKNVRVPDGYSSNISRCVHPNERSIWGLKSHDNHILMQQLIPIALRRVLPKHVVKALIEISNCFTILCSNAIVKADIANFEHRVALTLCSLEKIFPPGFFDVMEHLPIHLADELQNAGPVQYRWMYWMERYLQTLKVFMRNRAHPEASIAKAILMEECMTFCSRYMNDNVETKLSRPLRNDDGGDYCGRAIGKPVPFQLDHLTLTQVHRYVLANTDSVLPFMEKHLAELAEIYPQTSQQHIVKRLHYENFATWFKDHVNGLVNDTEISGAIRSLALGPMKDAFSCKGYIVRGFRFRVKEVDDRRKTQNSGVICTSGDATFYGQLTHVFQIHYFNDQKFVLFKCNWINERVGKKVDEFKFTLVNFKHLLYNQNRPTDEPFILASQAYQVFYVQDPLEPDWHVVVKTKPRDRFDKYSNVENETAFLQVDPFSMQDLDITQHISWVRDEIDGSIIDTTIPENNSDEEERDE